MHTVAMIMIFWGSLSGAQQLEISPAKSFAKMMKSAMEAKDAPAACWYLGLSEGYLQGLKKAGNNKASLLLEHIKGAEGQCGGKNSLNLETTFGNSQWKSLADLQRQIEGAEL